MKDEGLERWKDALSDESCIGGIAVYQGMKFEIGKRVMQAMDIEDVKLYIQDFNKFTIEMDSKVNVDIVREPTMINDMGGMSMSDPYFDVQHILARHAEQGREYLKMPPRIVTAQELQDIFDRNF